MVETETLLPFSSILFLVVIELGGRVDKSEIKKLAMGQKRKTLGFVPNLGFLTIAHLTNVFLLTIAYLIISIEFITTDDLIVTLLLLAVIVIIYIIPYLEVEEYDLLIRGKKMSSMRVHAIMTGIIAIEPVLFILLPFMPESMYEIIGVTVFTITYFIGTSLFLHVLRRELREQPFDG